MKARREVLESTLMVFPMYFLHILICLQLKTLDRGMFGTVGASLGVDVSCRTVGRSSKYSTHFSMFFGQH